MTLCIECKKDYIEHDEGMLQKCNRAKDKTIIELRLKLAFYNDKTHTERFSQ